MDKVELDRIHLQEDQSLPPPNLDAFFFSANIIHEKGFTIRPILGGPSEIQESAWDTAVSAVRHAFQHIKWDGHLFISVVGADVVQSGESEEDCGFGVYHWGMQHLLVCAGELPKEIPLSPEEWLMEIRRTVYHEIAHYMQDLRGAEANEDEANRIAEELSNGGG